MKVLNFTAPVLFLTSHFLNYFTVFANENCENLLRLSKNRFSMSQVLMTNPKIQKAIEICRMLQQQRLEGEMLDELSRIHSERNNRVHYMIRSLRRNSNINSSRKRKDNKNSEEEEECILFAYEKLSQQKLIKSFRGNAKRLRRRIRKMKSLKTIGPCTWILYKRQYYNGDFVSIPGNYELDSPREWGWASGQINSFEMIPPKHKNSFIYSHS